MYGPPKSGYGAAESSMINLGAVGAEQKGGMNFHAQSIGFMVMPPFLLFTFMDIVFSFLSGVHIYLAVLLAAICIAFCCLLAAIGRSHVKGPIYTFVSILCFLATANGIMAGLSIQARFYQPYWNFKHRPDYSNVLATDPADAMSDAGVIGFANNAIVDTFRSGHMLGPKGESFCVAPILDESQQSRAEYWAIGMDCCSGHVGFYCDDVQDSKARSGTIVFETGSYFAMDPYDMYQRAVRQAGARNSMQIPERPILVRWVKDPAAVADDQWREGSLHIAAGMFFYALASGIVAMVLHAGTSMSQR